MTITVDGKVIATERAAAGGSYGWNSPECRFR